MMAFLKEYRLLILLMAAFIILRLPGLHIPYYQDEWKNVNASATVESAGAFFAHPPFMQIVFVAGHAVLGEDYFRALPLLFSVAALVLLYAVMKRRAGKEAALWSVFLFTVCFYSILGSLMPDVDGSVMPFLFLASVYAYDRWALACHASDAADDRAARRWLMMLIGICLIGLLVKLSFILAIGALISDYAWSNRKDLRPKKILTAIGGLIVFSLVYFVLLNLIQWIYPSFSIDFMLHHAGQFTGGEGRNWTQIAVQGIKALFYLSPFLIIPLVFISKETLKKTRPFAIYMVISTIFYFVLFDFSRGALDKYLMFSIVPLCAIAGLILSSIFKSSDMSERSFAWKWPVIAGALLSAGLLALNLLPQALVALYPKTEWFSRVLHGEWNVLTPFNGGSGPMGFYVSFLFIAVSFIASVIVGIAAFAFPRWSKIDMRVPAAIMLIFIGMGYNAAFAEEYLSGNINGSAAQVLSEASIFIKSSKDIEHVITYNDIGARELSEIGKYDGRFYAAPEFEAGHREKFAAYKGQYLVVDMPHIYEDGFYGKFFAVCRVIFETASGKIKARVYDCPQAANIIKSLK